MSGKFYAGTSGWSYGDWKGIFYPKGTKSTDYLNYYATLYNCTEINSSFYNMPLQKTVQAWTDKTPDDFKFCVKLFRGITHYRKLQNCEEMIGEFFQRLEPMKSKMGPLLIQLPASVKFKANTAEDLYAHLAAEYTDYRFALEARDLSWYTEESLYLMTEYKIIHVIADAGKRFPCHVAVTANEVYLRFHGREQLYASSYTEEELRPYAEWISEWLKEGLDVWVFFNNTMYGNALTNLDTLQAMLNKGF